MQHRLSRSFSAFCLLSAVLAASLTVRGDSKTLLQDGINLYQSGKFDEAKEKFGQLRSDSYYNFTALYNLGNIAVRQKHLGEALAFYRSALNLKPLDPDTRANIRFVLAGLGIRQFPAARGSWEIYRVEILNSLTIDQLLAALGIASFFFLFNLYKFIKRRKLACFADEIVPPQPPFIFYLWTILLVLTFTTSMAKIFDGYIERATVVASPKVDLRSGPAEVNASLADLGEGYEVQVQDESDGWKQVTALDGPRVGLTGWVKADSLVSTSSGGPW